MKDQNGHSKPWKKCEKLKLQFERYGIEDFGGESNLHLLNETGTTKTIQTSMQNICQMLQEKPEQNHLLIYVIAGHGMVHYG